MGEDYFSTLAEVKMKMEEEIKSAKRMYRFMLMFIWGFIVIIFISEIIKTILGNWTGLISLIVSILLGLFLIKIFGKFCKSQIREAEDDLKYPLISSKFSSLPILISKDDEIISVKGFGTVIKMIDGEKTEIEYSKDLNEWENIKIEDGIIFNSSKRIYIRAKDSDFLIYPCGVSSFKQDILKIKE